MYRALAVLLLLASSAALPAQGIGRIALPYSAMGPLPAAALRADVHEPIWGYDSTFAPCGSDPSCAWPVSMAVGDIDNDGSADLLLCMEQRLLLALGFRRDSAGVPTGLYVIWAWFDRGTRLFKHGWSKDYACIGDFDGDGNNEVAACIGPGGDGPLLPCYLSGGNQDSYRIAILGGVAAADPAFGNLPRPAVLADWPINDSPHGGWTCLLLRATNGSNIRCQAAHVNDGGPSDLEPRDIQVSDGQARRIAILDWVDGVLDNSHDQLPVYAPLESGAGTHTTLAFDLDGDGRDEALNNGVIDWAKGLEWDNWPLVAFQGCSNQYNHSDSIQPWDHDGDGVLETLHVHDCWDLLTEGHTPSGPALIWENSLAPALHGQAVCIGEFVAGPDLFGWDAREALISPKGIPGTLAIQSGAQWSYIYNGNSWEMAFCYPSSGPAGPRDFQARNFDWDGDRSSDEIFSIYGSTHEVWRVVPNPAFTGPLDQDPTPSPFPKVSVGAWPAYPYQFQLVTSFDDSVWSGGGSSAVTSDVMGDYREEIITAGRHGIEIAFNPATLANPIAHPSPWTDLDYRRRMQGAATRTVNYQQLGSLTAIEVLPSVTLVAPGETVVYEAHAIYSNGERSEVTADATFSSGPLGSFDGNVFTANSLGLCPIQASVFGVSSDAAAVANVTHERAIDPQPANSPVATYGAGGAGTGGIAPRLTTNGLPRIGNASFAIVAEDVVGQGWGLLLYSFAGQDVPLSGIGRLYVEGGMLWSTPLVADGVAGVSGAGTASVPIAVPFVPAFIGASVYAQGFFADEGAAVGRGISHTDGLKLTVAGPGFSNALGMEFARIRAGSFTMGSPEVDPFHSSMEAQHQVTLTRPFWMQTTEVTQAQWMAVMGTNPSYFQGLFLPAGQSGDQLPVESVSWHDAQAFIATLNALEPGANYRLPTEAEWEYACRAGSVTAYGFGDSAAALGSYAWTGENSWSRPHEVASQAPNAWGLYDMHGNVFEWCQDWQGSYPTMPQTDPTGPASGEYRENRGGSWQLVGWRSRSADRGGSLPTSRHSTVGLRLVRTSP